MHLFRNKWLHAMYLCPLFLFIVFKGPVLATLGEPVISIESNRASLKAVSKSISSHGAYTIHEDVADGATIRQL